MKAIGARPYPPPAFERCQYVDGHCTTWAHTFRPDHQPTTAAAAAKD